MSKHLHVVVVQHVGVAVLSRTTIPTVLGAVCLGLGLGVRVRVRVRFPDSKVERTVCRLGVRS
jgi:hypothetical protein